MYNQYSRPLQLQIRGISAATPVLSNVCMYVCMYPKPVNGFELNLHIYITGTW